MDDDESMEMTPLPTLYKRASDGSIQEWTIRVGTDTSGHGWIVTDYGKVGGKIQRTEDVVTEGKNVGRANETTAVEQAEAEALSKWEGKLKKGYVKTIEEAREGKTDALIVGGVAPMLAHPFAKYGHKIKFPALAQPKLDGHRCIAVYQNGEARLYSRTRKPITGLPHVCRAIESLCRSIGATSGVFDGELYNHDYHDNFEDLTGFIRSQTPKPGSEVVQYWIYDLVNDSPQSARAEAIAAISEQSVGALVAVPTIEVADEDEMVALFGEFMGQGYEGLMLRNLDGRYKIDGRSYDLQKVKLFQDAEYKLVHIESGRGKMQGKAVFHCEVEPGKTFKCKLVGRLDDLEQYLNEPDKWLGKMVTVQFQNLSSDGIPRFPVALRFRQDV
jgi:DNA ligase-1